jgi:hypothetical protein
MTITSIAVSLLLAAARRLKRRTTSAIAAQHEDRVYRLFMKSCRASFSAIDQSRVKSAMTYPFREAELASALGPSITAFDESMREPLADVLMTVYLQSRVWAAEQLSQSEVTTNGRVAASNDPHADAMRWAMERASTLSGYVTEDMHAAIEVIAANHGGVGERIGCTGRVCRAHPASVSERLDRVRDVSGRRGHGGGDSSSRTVCRHPASRSRVNGGPDRDRHGRQCGTAGVVDAGDPIPVGADHGTASMGGRPGRMSPMCIHCRADGRDDRVVPWSRRSYHAPTSTPIVSLRCGVDPLAHYRCDVRP